MRRRAQTAACNQQPAYPAKACRRAPSSAGSASSANGPSSAARSTASLNWSTRSRRSSQTTMPAPPSSSGPRRRSRSSENSNVYLRVFVGHDTSDQRRRVLRVEFQRASVVLGGGDVQALGLEAVAAQVIGVGALVRMQPMGHHRRVQPSAGEREPPLLDQLNGPADEGAGIEGGGLDRRVQKEGEGGGSEASFGASPAPGRRRRFAERSLSTARGSGARNVRARDVFAPWVSPNRGWTALDSPRRGPTSPDREHLALDSPPESHPHINGLHPASLQDRTAKHPSSPVPQPLHAPMVADCGTVLNFASDQASPLGAMRFRRGSQSKRCMPRA